MNINKKYDKTISEEHFKRCMHHAMSQISGRKCPRVIEENAPRMKNIYPYKYVFKLYFCFPIPIFFDTSKIIRTTTQNNVSFKKIIVYKRWQIKIIKFLYLSCKKID